MKRKISYLAVLTIVALIISACQVQDEQESKPKNIILLIGDGMGVSQVYAGLTANNGRLSLERCTHIGFSKTHSSNSYVTDSGAGGTAIATGTKTYNGAIGVNSDTLPLKTILEFAEEADLSTGLLSTSSITHATPASFIAHRKTRNDYEGIAADFLKVDIDVVVGGGRNNFSKRADSVDLLHELKGNGYAIVDQLSQLQEIEEGKVYALTSEEHNPRASEGRNNLLPDGLKASLTILSKNQNGFFVMAEGSMIDWGGHANDIQYIAEEMIDFDRAIEVALDFAEANQETLVLITADHETGGLGINQGDFETGEVIGGYTTAGHTGVMVPVFAFGPGAEKFSGIQDNTDLFFKMMDLLGLGDEPK